MNVRMLERYHEVYVSEYGRVLIRYLVNLARRINKGHIG